MPDLSTTSYKKMGNLSVGTIGWFTWAPIEEELNTTTLSEEELLNMFLSSEALTREVEEAERVLNNNPEQLIEL